MQEWRSATLVRWHAEKDVALLRAEDDGSAVYLPGAVATSPRPAVGARLQFRARQDRAGRQVASELRCQPRAAVKPSAPAAGTSARPVLTLQDTSASPGPDDSRELPPAPVIPHGALAGSVHSWDDERGFGFIQPDAGGPRVFLHISAYEGAGRPQAGMPVHYRADRDAEGRLRATCVQALAGAAPAAQRARRPGRRRPSWQALRELPLKLLTFILLCLPLVAVGHLQWQQGSLRLALVYVLASLLCLLLYWHDKRQALSGGWRVPENTLHFIELCGGWPGALIAQQLLRHKTRKLSFLLVLWSIILLHEAFWLDRLFMQGEGLRQLLQWLMQLTR